jgi:hypothetical protein
VGEKKIISQEHILSRVQSSNIESQELTNSENFLKIMGSKKDVFDNNISSHSSRLSKLKTVKMVDDKIIIQEEDNFASKLHSMMKKQKIDFDISSSSHSIEVRALSQKNEILIASNQRNQKRDDDTILTVEEQLSESISEKESTREQGKNDINLMR